MLSFILIYAFYGSSGITWEIKKVGKTRYKRMKQDDIDKMEEAYNRYQHECEIREDIASEVAITDKITVIIIGLYLFFNWR